MASESLTGIILSVLSARMVSAVLSLAASVVALMTLSQTEYAKASIAIVWAGVFLPLLFQPFAKYVLVTGEWRRITAIFWLTLPVSTVVLITVACVGYIVGLYSDVTLAFVAAVFAVTQGCKEYCGEMARAMGDLRRIRNLYVFDSALTLALTFVFLRLSPRAEMFLVASAVSSAVLCVALTPFRTAVYHTTGALADIRNVYAYSVGVVSATTINGGALALGRSAIMTASAGPFVGQIQFLLDFVQKCVALAASSMSSATVPEIRQGMTRPAVYAAVATMGAVFVAVSSVFALAAYAISYIPLGTEVVPFITALICVTFIWTHKYRNAVLDIPLISSAKRSQLLIPGAVVSLALTTLVSNQGWALHEVVSGLVFAVIVGGGISLSMAFAIGRLKLSQGLWLIGLPVLVALALTAARPQPVL